MAGQLDDYCNSTSNFCGLNSMANQLQNVQNVQMQQNQLPSHLLNALAPYQKMVDSPNISNLSSNLNSNLNSNLPPSVWPSDLAQDLSTVLGPNQSVLPSTLSTVTLPEQSQQNVTGNNMNNMTCPLAGNLASNMPNIGALSGTIPAT